MKEKKTTKAIKIIGIKNELCPEDFKYDYNPHLTKALDGIKDDFDIDTFYNADKRINEGVKLRNYGG